MPTRLIATLVCRVQRKSAVGSKGSTSTTRTVGNSRRSRARARLRVRTTTPWPLPASLATTCRPTKPLPPATRTRARSFSRSFSASSASDGKIGARDVFPDFKKGPGTIFGRDKSSLAPFSHSLRRRRNVIEVARGHDAKALGERHVRSIERARIEHRIGKHALHVVARLVERDRLHPDRAFHRRRGGSPRLRTRRAGVVGRGGKRRQFVQTIQPMPEVERTELRVEVDFGDPRRR